MRRAPSPSAAKVLLFGIVGGSIGIACSLAGSVLRRRRTVAALANKVVLITGASRGLGLALAEEFGRRGARLVLTARDPEELQRAQQLLSEKLRLPANDITIVPCDLRSSEDIAALFEAVRERFGAIDVLVNNAGVITVGPLENQTAKNFRDVMDTNFFSGVECTLNALPQMLARREGRIVNIASVGGKIAVPHMLPYSASKFAIVGFSQGLAGELASKGITVTTVCPGLMRTGSHVSAQFTGDVAREYRWFSLAASLPGISISVASAARKIVRAVVAGEHEVVITPQAVVAARLANLFPELTVQIMRLANLLLPSPVPGAPALRRGEDVRQLEIKPAVMMGTAAAKRYNQPSESASRTA